MLELQAFNVLEVILLDILVFVYWHLQPLVPLIIYTTIFLYQKRPPHIFTSNKENLTFFITPFKSKYIVLLVSKLWSNFTGTYSLGDGKTIPLAWISIIVITVTNLFLIGIWDNTVMRNPILILPLSRTWWFSTPNLLFLFFP